MPALRKNRKSRTSTPYAAPTESQEQGPREMTQTTLDAWKEPAPQNPQPNSEDHGSPRHALLENMAPLGSLPSTGIRQRVRGLGEAIGRSSLFSRSNGVSGEEAASTPEVTPAPEPEQDDSEIQDEEEAHTSYGGQGGEEEDDDYMPTKGKKNAKAKTPVKVKSPVQSKTTVHNKTPTKNGTRKASTAPPISATQKSQHPYADGVSEQRMQIAVNDAISRCNESNKQILGTAILEVFDDSKSDNNLATALDAIVRQKGDPSHWETFRINIKSRKRRIKRDVEKKKKKKQDKRGSGVTHGLKKIKEATRSRVRRLSRKASSEVAPEDSSSAGNALEDVVPAGSPSKPVDSATEDVMESASRRGSVQAPPHPLTTAPTLPAAESVSEPTTRLPSKSPRKQTITNGDHATATSLDANGTASTTAPTPAAKTPDSGTGSDSELSEVNEEIVQKGPPEPVKANGKSAVAASTAPVPKKGKNTIGGRGGKKTRGGASKQSGKNERRQPPTPEELAEQDNIERKRQAYAESQLVRQVELNIPVSDIRFDDEILETESLTESQIAVGPPVDSTRPRRAGRAPRKDAKRLREDDSRVSSPQLESSATTRPSTPVFHGPKRIKLNNGQAARTKQSPVKNRDGPIAGIPHTGGGGSRQLGPDDNDPSSPQSDSDDLCSACKGAGKFVCCEDCPRVFHLICCDPPLESPPDGPFYCPECLVKRNRAEDPAPESGGRLGPLFKSLESINPRSFVLPTDIQEFFDGVSARPDGSYHEEVKKFPLPKASGYGHQKPDYCRPFDADGNVILCCQCGLSSQGNRPILKCDFCTAYWHLDCLNPPLANPPYIDNEATHRDAWRCPRHIEHDLRSGKLVQNDLNETEKDAEMTDATSYERVRRVPRKVRMPRKPEIVEPTFTRGTRNNGLIDIMNDSEDETDGEGNYVFNLDEPKDMNSKLFRLPEKGIVLDFVSKVKSGRIEKKTENRKTAGSDKSARAAAQRKSIMQNFAAHPIQQQQAALNLARLANKEKDIGLSESNVDALILGLTAEAPTEVVTSISNAPPPPVADDERAQLLKLQELIQRRLNG